MNNLNISPKLSHISERTQLDYKEFYKKTDEKNIDKFSKGASLDRLTRLAEKARFVVNFGNPFPISNHQTYQWEMDHLSDIKQRLHQAINQKLNYYEKDTIGKIKKIILKLFGRWNGGATKSIERAEDFLLFWDSNQPLYKITHPESSSYGKYGIRQDFPGPSHKKHANFDHFFNYTPIRPRVIA